MTRTLLLAVALAGCAELPRDPDGTAERVRREERFRVGLIAGGGDRSREAALLSRVAAGVPARPRVEAGDAETLLGRLEKRELDLVVGKLDGKTPWAKRVHIIPLNGTKPRTGVPLATAATPPGENRWANLVERNARAVRAP